MWNDKQKVGTTGAPALFGQNIVFGQVQKFPKFLLVVKLNPQKSQRDFKSVGLLDIAFRM